MISLAHSLNHARSTSTRHSEGHAAILHVRTRDIQFDGWNTLQSIDTRCTRSIILRRGAADIDYHIRIDILDLWINMLTEIIDTFILQSYTVEHTLSRLHHTGIIVSLTGIEGGALHDDTSNTVERHKISKLQPVAKRARGRHHGIFQR